MRICWTDFETGGLDVNEHSPLSFAMVFTDGPNIVDEWYTQIRQAPLVTVPQAMAVNKINLDEPGLTFAQFKTEYFKRLAPHGFRPMFAGHNCPFDRPWLQKIVGKDDGLHYHSIDTMTLGNSLKAMNLINPKSQKLGDLCEYLEVKVDGDMHNALTDAKAAFYCFLKLREFLLKGKWRPAPK